MALDSVRKKPSSSITGTRPLGFIARYSGVLLSPKAPPASMRSNASPISSQHHTTFCTFTDESRPQMRSIRATCFPRVAPAPPFPGRP